MAATLQDSMLPAGSGQGAREQSWALRGWAGISGAGPRLGIFGFLLLGPFLTSVCSSDCLISLCRLGDRGLRPKRGFCHPLHVPLPYLSPRFLY